MTDRSRMPAIERFRVRGIGVAVSVRTSTSDRYFLRRSFCATPKRCSSSMISSPSFGSLRSLDKSLCVPTTISTWPLFAWSMTALVSFAVLNRLSTSTVTGQSAKRSRNDSKCCCASSVVGTNTHTCLPLLIEANAARMATSVLPKPTSPQTNRSIGRGAFRSLRTASIEVS